MKKLLSCLLVFANTLAMAPAVMPAGVSAAGTDTYSAETGIRADVWDFASYTSQELSWYDEMYAADIDRKATLTNNGGHYGTSYLANVYDGNDATFWETAQINAYPGNPNGTKNYIDFTFQQAESIGRVVYLVRQDNQYYNGFPLEFKIYGSESDAGQWTELAHVTFENKIKERIEISFPEQSLKRLRFEYTLVEQYAQPGYSNPRPSAAEFRFYKEDKALSGLRALFTDNTLTTLNPDVDTAKADAAWQAVENTYPRYMYEAVLRYYTKAYELLGSTAPHIVTQQDYPGLFLDESCSVLTYGVTKEYVDELAKYTNDFETNMQPYINAAYNLLGVSGYENIHEAITLSQRGKRETETSRTQVTYNIGGQYDITGYYAMPGETIGIYANYDPKGPVPKIVFATANQDHGAW